MKRTLLILALAACCLCSCQKFGGVVVCKGGVVEKNMGLSNFSMVEIVGAASVQFKQGNEYKVIVTANEEVFDFLEYKVSEGILTVDTKNHVAIKASTYKVLIQAPRFTSIEADGTADLQFREGYVSDGWLDIEVDGAANLDFKGIVVPALGVDIEGAATMKIQDILVDDLGVEIEGAGSVIVSGIAAHAKLSVTGAARIDARDLVCSDIVKRVEGAAKILLP